MLKDKFNKDASILEHKKLWLLDMDGTIYNDNTLFDGTLSFLEQVKQAGGHYVFVTNNSSRSVKDYMKKLDRIGIKASYDEFYTSSQATSQFILENYPTKKVYCEGTKSLVKELKKCGINVVTKYSPDIDMVLLGFDTELVYQKLKDVSKLLINKKDILYYATNCDLRCPVNFGYMPDCGSIAQALQNTTGRYPIFIGKPEPTMLELAMEKYHVSKEETALIGDRIYTDIASGVNAGIDSILVLSGEATLEDLDKSEIKPTFIFDSIKNLVK